MFVTALDFLPQSPEEGYPIYVPMLAALRRLFDRYQQNGRICLEYETHMYYGRIL